MVHARSSQKCDRVTVTLVPNVDERSLIQVPSTFNRIDRMYGWRRSERMDYMIVPTRISNTEIKLDFFVSRQKGTRSPIKNLHKTVQEFIEDKIESEWRGLKLAGVGRPTTGFPPNKSYVRGTIEEMLGASLEG
jgi:hypothetical protein